MPNEITNQDIMDMLTVLVERTNRINDLEKKIDVNFDRLENEMNDHFREIDVKLENKIEPKLQLLLENQGSASDNSKKIAAVEQRQDELEDKVDGLGYAVQELQKKMA